MYDAAEALKEAMLALGLACDGGKDSVSMVARAGDEVGPGSRACMHPAQSHLRSSPSSHPLDTPPSHTACRKEQDLASAPSSLRSGPSSPP